MTDEGEQDRHFWWQLADQHRGLPDAQDPIALTRLASDQGLVTGWRQLAELAGRAALEIVDPRLVGDFALAYTANGPAVRVLDPWAGLGVTLAALEDGGRLESGVAIEINAEIYQLARDVRRASRVRWRLGDSSNVLADDIGSFDLVVGSPPWGLPRTVLETHDPDIRLRASKTYTMLVQAALKLRPTGALIALLPESLFAPMNAAVLEALSAASVYPNAALAVPLRMFASRIPLSLVVLTHERFDSMFLAELDSSSDFGAIVANLRARREGRLPQLGRLVEAGRFVSWRATIREEEIRRAARAIGLRIVPFREFCSEIRAPRNHEPAFEPEPNAVYLPKLGTSPAVTSAEAMAIKPQNYLQLFVRPEVVDPEYLAAFMSSPLGRKVRDQLTSGGTIPHISLTTLRSGFTPLPPDLSQQHAATRVGRTLSELRLSVAGLERRLWEQPLQAGRVEADLRQLLEGDGMERWIDSLPFPLASILWRYLIEEDAEKRCQYLIHFFLGTAVFLVDLHFSALNRNPQVLDAVGRRASTDASYSRSSIGIWADLLSRLAKRTRELVSKDGGLARELFSVSDLDRLNAVSSKALVGALRDEAATYRNRWIGHGAVVGPHEWASRLLQAEGTLSRMRAGTADAFDGWNLMRMGAGSNRDGLITTSTERLMGSRTSFRKSKVGLREWPEDGGLYMLEDGASVALRLNSLVTLQRSPKSVEDAAYFYDRIEAEGVHWVSYHFEPLPEVVRPDSAVAQLIDQLNALG